ncbi:pyridoxal-phosphate dependent enzyme [Candidatus Roizmanbacteria bacterium]|nr:pyridoxal-phosphate dependent enzyme [Candidatus Roizmanbacteria bacterium]
MTCKKKLKDTQIICPKCKNVYSLVTLKYFVRKKLSTIEEMYRYFLPFQLFNHNDFKNCSLSKYGDGLWLKDEGLNQSKSIKEKDILIGLKCAFYLGYKKTMCVSGGSGIQVVSSLSKNTIPVTLYSPTSTRILVDNQILMGNDYEETFRMSLKMQSDDLFNITPGINPYSQEGCKTISWQLIESKIKFDIIIIPCGNGSSLWGIYNGFKEAKAKGFISKIPKIFGVELAHGPIHHMLRTGKIRVNKNILNSKAISVDVKESFCLQKASYATKDSHGGIVKVSESNVIDSYNQIRLANKQISFTAATAFAAALKLRKKNPKSIMCCIMTSHH